jgi:hypothetical protein
MTLKGLSKEQANDLLSILASRKHIELTLQNDDKRVNLSIAVSYVEHKIDHMIIGDGSDSLRTSDAIEFTAFQIIPFQEKQLND